MKITATKVKAKELEPGDLFSTAGQYYWDHSANIAAGSVGEKVYIRTEMPARPDQEEEEIYRITITK